MRSGAIGAGVYICLPPRGALNCRAMAARRESRARPALRRPRPASAAGSVADWLRIVTAIPGVSGQEHHAADAVARAFSPFSDRVERDRMNCVRAWIDGLGPKP